MIRPLENDETIELAKARLTKPFKLFHEWLFGWDNIADDFEYLFDTKDTGWLVIMIKILFSIPIYFIVGVYKVVKFCLSPFELGEYLESVFEFVCCTFILTIFGTIRLPFAIYTYMRFNKATALIHMLKSD